MGSTLRRTVTTLAAALAATVIAAPAALAQDAPPAFGTFPGFVPCPTDTGGCAAINVRSGLVDFSGFQVPITDGSTVIRGGLDGLTFKPITTGDYGVSSTPLTIPGGVFGVDLPFNNLFGLTAAQAQLVATAAPQVDLLGPQVTLTARFKVINKLVGDSCSIGSPSFPVTIDLTSAEDLGTLLGRAGAPEDAPAGTLGIPAVTTTATDFPLPPAQGCGPFGVLNPVVDFRSHTPSDGTGNSLTTTADVYLNSSYNTPAAATSQSLLESAAAR